MADGWRGIFPILITPFTPGLDLDEEGLRRQVEFCLRAGAAGLVGPANASEFATLADDERRRWIEVVVAAADGRVPVIAAVTSGHAVAAAGLARFARDAGAAGIMSMPPPLLKPDEAGCCAYYRALAEAVDRPVVVQNYGPPLGTPMSAAALARLCRQVDGVDYIKEEVAPEPRMISATLAAVGSACRGIFGGQGGLYLVDEFRRGAVGNMPGSHTTDLLVDVWRLLEAGQEAAARERFARLLPLMVCERLHGVAVYKEVLRRRGIIACAARRAPGGELDAADRHELDLALAGIEPLFRAG